MAFVIIGAILVLAGLLLVWLRRRLAARVATAQATAVVSAGSAANAPPGATLAVEGLIRCDRPLLAELSESPCVYFSAHVVDKWDDVETDSDGQRRRTQRSSTVLSKSDRTPFMIEDGAGIVRIEPERADIHADSSFNRSETRGDVTRTFTERTLAVGTRAYVLGVMQPGGAIGGARKQTFVIDNRSGQDRLAAQRRSLSWMAIGAALFLVVGVVVFVLGLSGTH